MNRILTILVGGAMLLLGAACSSDDGDMKLVAPPQFSAQQKIVSEKLTDFDLDYFKTANKSQADKNFVVSPLSASMMLSMLANGETDDIRRQICDVLGTSDVETLNSLARDYLDWLPSSDPAVRLSMAQSVWYSDVYTLNGDFVRTVADFFDAPVYARDFSNTEALKNEINKWGSDNTNGLVPDFLKKIDPKICFFIFNAMYFNGKWSEPFEKDRTRRATFHGTKGKSKVYMMNDLATREYAWGDDFEAVKLEYGNAKISALLILPGEGTDIDTFIASGRIADVAKADTKPYPVQLGLPRFKIAPEDRMSLDETLYDMGITGLMEDHEPPMLERPTFPFQVKTNQQCSVEFNEEGTEAAVVTDAEGWATSPGPDGTVDLVFDRPFVFLITENTGDRVLFAGKVTNL